MASTASHRSEHLCVTLPGCRVCGGRDLRPILDFGHTPLADQLHAPDRLPPRDLEFPLRLVFCPESALVQITANVAPEVLYGGDYPYYTSVSPELVEHFARGARAILARKPLGPRSLVIEAASNDGYQLKVFQAAGARVLGVDPASGPAKAANDAGIETLCRFFDAKLAGELRETGRRADVITGNNVLNLLQDLDDFADACDALLADDGMIVLEVPYLVDTIDKTAFDNVFHQNVTYWTLTALDRYFRRHGFFVNDVERIPTFGGSLRVYVERTDARRPAAQAVLDEEHRRGVDGFEFYARFGEKVERIKSRILEMLRDLRAQGKRVVAYGAAGGMATTLLAYLGLDAETIEYAVDINPHKHGRITAGSRLTIHAPKKLLDDRPDCVLLLAWNFADSVLAQQSAYRDQGGRFLVPLPEPRLM